jgi:hypothetical protein
MVAIPIFLVTPIRALELCQLHLQDTSFLLSLAHQKLVKINWDRTAQNVDLTHKNGD